jgi:hypothetical protein
MFGLWWFLACRIVDVVAWVDEFLATSSVTSIICCLRSLLFLSYCMSIFKRVIAWPWKKIITVVVKVGTWILDKLPDDPPKPKTP